MKKLITTLSLVIAGVTSFKAQHYSLYSQYVLNALAINPAVAGSNEMLDANVLHRRQWSGFNGSPVNTSFTVSSPVKSFANNLGLSFINDKVGVSINQYVNAIYAYRFRLKNMYGSFGIQAGLNMSNTDWESLKRNEANDEVFQNAQRKQTGITTGVGYYMYSPTFFVGLSSPGLVNTNGGKSFGGGPLLVNAGYNINLKDSSQIKPSLLVRSVVGSPIQFDLNLMYCYKRKIGGGFSYRYKESIIALLEYAPTKDLKLAYCYDFGISALKKNHHGSHEIMIRYLIRLKKPTEEKTEDPK